MRGRRKIRIRGGGGGGGAAVFGWTATGIICVGLLINIMSGFLTN